MCPGLSKSESSQRESLCKNVQDGRHTDFDLCKVVGSGDIGIPTVQVANLGTPKNFFFFFFFFARWRQRNGCGILLAFHFFEPGLFLVSCISKITSG